MAFKHISVCTYFNSAKIFLPSGKFPLGKYPPLGGGGSNCTCVDHPRNPEPKKHLEASTCFLSKPLSEINS